jgi:hypothetical protein
MQGASIMVLCRDVHGNPVAAQRIQKIELLLEGLRRGKGAVRAASFATSPIHRAPKRLFKYLAFSNRALDLLVGDNLYFADPSTFNDPLDTRPCLYPDLGSEELEAVFRQLAEQRIHAEMTAAAKALAYRVDSHRLGCCRCCGPIPHVHAISRYRTAYDWVHDKARDVDNNTDE